MSRRKRDLRRHARVYKSRSDRAGIACLPKNRLSGWRIRWVGGRRGVGRPRWEMKRDLLLREAKRELLLTEHLRLCCSFVFVPVPRRICPRFPLAALISAVLPRSPRARPAYGPPCNFFIPQKSLPREGA